MSGDVDRGPRVSSLSQMDLSRFRLYDLRQRPEDLTSIEAERRMREVGPRVEQIREEWKNALKLGKDLPTSLDKFKRRLEGAYSPGNGARSSITEAVGSLPKGAVVEIFRKAAQPAR